MANSDGFQRIIINELDLTAQGFAEEDVNIAFIPGLVGTNESVEGQLDRTIPTYKHTVDNNVVYSPIKYVVNTKVDATSLFRPNGYPIVDTTAVQTFTIVGEQDTTSNLTAEVKVNNLSVSGTVTVSYTAATSDKPAYLTVTVTSDDTTPSINSDCDVDIVVKSSTTTIAHKVFEYKVNNYLYNRTSGLLYLYGEGTYIPPVDPTTGTPITNADTLIIDANLTANEADDNPEAVTGLSWFVVDMTAEQGTVYLPPEETPIYCKDVSTFESYFGKYPYQFTAQDNLDLNPIGSAIPDTTKANFNAVAVPYTKKLYNVGEYDRSYVMAKELINRGLAVLYDCHICRQQPVSNNDYSFEFGNETAFDVVDFYKFLETLFSAESDLADKSVYSFKYITSGGFPYLEYLTNDATTTDADHKTSYENMLRLAAKRGDAYVIGDPLNNPARPLQASDSDSLYGTFVAAAEQSTPKGIAKGEYGCLMPIWFSYNCDITKRLDASGYPRVITSIIMPPSFAYLSCMAEQIKNNPAWLACAGVTRGQVPNLNYLYTNFVSSQKVADSYQETDAIVNVNAITEVKPYGYCVFGNRTTFNNKVQEKLTASSFLNLRNLLCDVKKTLYRAAQTCLFEQNTEILWVNFKSMVTPLLDQMVSGQGIERYKFVQLKSKERGKLEAQLILWPIYAVEQVEVTVVLTDDNVSVSEQ